MHATKLLDFLLARDCKVELTAIPAPQLSFASLLDVFERGLEQEQQVTKQIDALYETAFTEKAFAAVAELQWFLTEQVEEEKTGREIVTKLKMTGHDPASLLDMDRELGARTGVEVPPPAASA
jgi:ferritin